MGLKDNWGLAAGATAFGVVGTYKAFKSAATIRREAKRPVQWTSGKDLKFIFNNSFPSAAGAAVVSWLLGTGAQWGANKLEVNRIATEQGAKVAAKAKNLDFTPDQVATLRAEATEAAKSNFTDAMFWTDKNREVSLEAMRRIGKERANGYVFQVMKDHEDPLTGSVKRVLVDKPVTSMLDRVNGEALQAGRGLAKDAAKEAVADARTQGLAKVFQQRADHATRGEEALHFFLTPENQAAGRRLVEVREAAVQLADDTAFQRAVQEEAGAIVDQRNAAGGAPGPTAETMPPGRHAAGPDGAPASATVPEPPPGFVPSAVPPPDAIPPPTAGSS